MTQSSEGRSRGLLYVLAATAIAGAAGYLIQLAAPALLHDADAYLSFSVFWSTLYLFVAAISGVQQEVTRATHPVADGPATQTTVPFTLWALGAIILVAIIAGVAFSPVAFAEAPVVMTASFALGLGGYLLVAVLSGLLYGLSLWLPIALLTVIDALVRAVLVVIGLALQVPAGLLAFLVAVPFVAAFGAVWLTFRASVRSRYRLDVDVRRLAQNSAGTVVAAAAIGLMVTGLPLLLRTALPTYSAVSLAGLVLTITLTRAPLIVPLMALQSWLIVEFRNDPERRVRRLIAYVATIFAGTALLGLAAWFWGQPLVDLISGSRYSVEPGVAAAVMGSAGLVAAMCVTGPALLSASSHRWYVGGWVVAACVTVAALLLPTEPALRATSAMVVAPVVGLAVHSLGVVRSSIGLRTAIG